MKSLQRPTQAERPRATASSSSQHRQAPQVSPASATIAASPHMTSQRQTHRAAVGPAVSPVQLQRDAEQMPREEESVSEGVMQRMAAAEAAPNLTGMPNHLKTGLEALSGMDMSDVRVHRNSEKPARLNALAYARGNEIHLGPGQEKHLGHEAWHVVQQRQGRVRATMQMAGVGVNADAGLEREADWMGRNAVAGLAQLIGGRKKQDRTSNLTNSHLDQTQSLLGRAAVFASPPYGSQFVDGFRWHKDAATIQAKFNASAVVQRETEIKHTPGYVTVAEGGGEKNFKVGKKMEALLDVNDPVVGTATGPNWTWMQVSV